MADTLTCACGCGDALPAGYIGSGCLRGHHMRLGLPAHTAQLAAARAQQRVGEDHPNWRHGQHPRSRKRYKAATCERCGFVPEHACQLDVHRHTRPLAERETLCANCHRMVGLFEARTRRYDVSWREAAPAEASA